VIPDEVLVPRALESEAALADWLSGQRGKRVKVFMPHRGQRRRLLDLAEKNAASSFASRSRRDDDAELALRKLQDRLGLKSFPARIECYDIAHIQGAATVASMVVFEGGVPAKAAYRKFKVKSSTNDDFASMYEVLRRRFKRALDDDAHWAAPDLVVIDGGKGQLGSALAALEDLGIDGEVEVVALAKERDDDTPDRVYRRGAKDAIRIRANTAELYLLSRLRDEAHRFANTYHRQRRTKAALRSRLDDIPGIGAKRRTELLRHFGSAKAVAAASAEELARVPGMTAAAAAAVAAHFAGPSKAMAADDDGGGTEPSLG
jgi:excinuclease ABC subunit C